MASDDRDRLLVESLSLSSPFSAHSLVSSRSTTLRMDDQLAWPSLKSVASVRGKTRALNPTRGGGDSWQRIEELAEKILRGVHPTAGSEEKRNRVIAYVQKLFGGVLGVVVVPFGSVPLKTYLPDGDIDITAINYQDPDSDFSTNVISILDSEEHKKDAEFEVKDIQYINAEVKLVKCLIQNIAVDISFNQPGGLTTLCFLELVDHQIGKDHLFKRSIILIKSWCYYESRILGAFHGLISTYALEILILHIFNIFHKSLYGPLGVLYKFLDYYSKFDWKKYCISLQGPVALSSLPNLLVELPESDADDLLLRKEFLYNTVGILSLYTWRPGSSDSVFPKKFLNIIDPLKETNNLGRSVSMGNFYRICSAWSYGARKLGEILTLPEEFMENELRVFFMNTLDRHGNKEKSYEQDQPTRTFHGLSKEGTDKVKLSPRKMEQGRMKRSETMLPKKYHAAEVSVNPKTRTKWGKISTTGAQCHLSPGTATARTRFGNYKDSSPIADTGTATARTRTGNYKDSSSIADTGTATARTRTGNYKDSSSIADTDCILARRGDGTIGIAPSSILSDLTTDLNYHLTALQTCYGLSDINRQVLTSVSQRSTMFPQMKTDVPVSDPASSHATFTVKSFSDPVSHSTEDRMKSSVSHSTEDRNKTDDLGTYLSNSNEVDCTKSTPLRIPRSSHFQSSGFSQAKGITRQPKGRRAEFGFHLPLTFHTYSQELCRKLGIICNPTEDPALPPDSKSPMAMVAYNLEDNGDFPPLSI